MLEAGSHWAIAAELPVEPPATSGARRTLRCDDANIDTDESNPASRFLLHVLIAAAEFERELIHERATAGLNRYRQQYAAGKVGKETRS